MLRELERLDHNNRVEMHGKGWRVVQFTTNGASTTRQEETP